MGENAQTDKGILVLEQLKFSSLIDTSEKWNQSWQWKLEKKNNREKEKMAKSNKIQNKEKKERKIRKE